MTKVITAQPPVRPTASATVPAAAPSRAARQAKLRAELRETFHADGEHRTTAEAELFTTTSQAAADRFVYAVVDGGGSVASVTPHRETLEARFVKDATEAERAVDGRTAR